MPWLRRSSLWHPTMGSQREAQCYKKEFNRSQEAKSLWWLSNIRTKTGPFSVETYKRGKIL